MNTPLNSPQSSTANFLNRLEKSISKNITWTPIVLFSALGLLIFVLAVRGTVAEFLSGTHQQEFLLIFLLTMYFPLTYIAYYRMVDQRRINLLRQNVHLLGYNETEVTNLADKTHSPFSYILFISLTVLLCIMGLSLFLWLPDQMPDNGALSPGLLIPGLSITINANTLQAMRYGFLGAYIFSAYLLYRRYSTNDLHPTVYLYCAFTLLAGMAFNYVAFEALAKLAATADNTKSADGIGAGLIAILAFSIGYFPYLAVRWFNRLAHSTFQVGERRADAKPLGMIDGISDWHETRLRDNGIDDVQNLASAEIIDLLVNTSFTTQQVIAWIDQAILYQYLDQAEIESFRRGKINMFTDFLNQVNDSKGDPIPDEQMKALATTLQTTQEKLNHLRISIKNGPNAHRVNKYWELSDKEASKVKAAIPKPADGSWVIEEETPRWANLPEDTSSIPFDYYFLNHTSFLRPEKQAEFQAKTHVLRDHYDIRVIVDSYYPGAFDRIDHVEYILHKSYPNPRQFRDNPEDKFMLKELANGQFVLMAEVFLKDQKEPIRLQRFITLWKSGPKFPEVTDVVSRDAA